MAIEFPALVFKDGGSQQRAGGSYSYLAVENEQDFHAAISSGWFATLPEAIEATAISNAQPTRAELEFKATELGIKFDGRTTDRKLGELIAAIIEA